MNRPANTCSADRCQQGRTACPCPQACEVAEEELEIDVRMTALEVIALSLFILFCITGLLALASNTALLGG